LWNLYYSLTYEKFNMDIDSDDELPPNLIAVDGTQSPTETALSAAMGDVKVAKVPITIITGKQTSCIFLCGSAMGVEEQGTEFVQQAT
jgi:hypothetical protein